MTIIINGTREQSYWLERPADTPLDQDTWHDLDSGDRQVSWPAGLRYQTNSSGPGGLNVRVAQDGISVLNTSAGSPYRPGYARWLANRLIEAAAIYETALGGDGSQPGAIAMRGAYAQDLETQDLRS